MNANNSFTRTAGLLAGALLLLSGASLGRAANAEADALPTFHENFLKVGVSPANVSDSKAGFMARTQMFRKGSAGIEEFNVTEELDKTTTLTVDGRALLGAEDYLASFKLTKTEVGSFEAGYKSVRTFYDGAGGFFPINNAWLPLYSRQLFVDRGAFYVNGAINLPKAPVFTFSYRNETRSGRKDSTIWGDTNQTGIPIYRPTSLNLVSASRKLIPAYINLSERRETWEVAMKQTVGATSYRFSILGTKINNHDTRTVDRNPGELSPRPALPSNPTPPLLVSPFLAANQTKGTDMMGLKEDGLTLSGRIETKLSDSAKVFLSLSQHHSEGDLAQSRLITAYIMTDAGLTTTVGGYTPGGRSPYSQSGSGTIKQDVFTGVVGLEFKPTRDLEMTAGLKGEDLQIEGNYTANYVLNMVTLTTGAVAPQSLTAPNSTKISESPWVPELSGRYTGVKDMAFWFMWDYSTLKQDERNSYVGLTTSTGPMVLTAPSGANARVKDRHSNLKVGANWTPNSMIMVRGEVFTKDHENNFTGQGTALGSYYILDYDTYGARVTATVKPMPGLSFSTRYLVQRGKAEIAEDGYVHTNSNDSRRYQLSETVDWNPNKSVYVQGNLCMFWDTIGTVYPRAGGAANDVLHNADNNFWNASVVTGYVVDKDTDAQIQGTYYKANNWNPSLAAATTPYGQGGKDYSVTVGLKHKFSDRLVGSAKVGYFKSDSETTGGFANYKGTIGWLTLDYKL
ncbi:MAG: hypothetical protein HZA93_05930 [Verrucomicrobia bacterium]|nr:hypothetical protein [Verrucomicrobiota bacterium]